MKSENMLGSQGLISIGERQRRIDQIDEDSDSWVRDDRQSHGIKEFFFFFNLKLTTQAQLYYKPIKPQIIPFDINTPKNIINL